MSHVYAHAADQGYNKRYMPIWTSDRGFKKVVRVQYGEARDIATVILTIVILYFACQVCTTDIGGKTALRDHVWIPWEV